MANTEIKKQFNELIKKYFKVQAEKSKAVKAEKAASEQLKKLWEDFDKSGIKADAAEFKEKKENIKINFIVKAQQKIKYYSVLMEVYEKILSSAAKNIIIDALKEETEKEKNKLKNPIRFKVVNDFLCNILESETVHCYVKVSEFRAEISFYIQKDEYKSKWIDIDLYNVLKDHHYREDLYIDPEKVKAATFSALNYNPEEIAKNYIKFMETAKKELEKFKKKWAVMREKGTLKHKFVFMGDGKNSISETFYF